MTKHQRRIIADAIKKNLPEISANPDLLTEGLLKFAVDVYNAGMKDAKNTVVEWYERKHRVEFPELKDL